MYFLGLGFRTLASSSTAWGLTSGGEGCGVRWGISEGARPMAVWHFCSSGHTAEWFCYLRNPETPACLRRSRRDGEKGQSRAECSHSILKEKCAEETHVSLSSSALAGTLPRWGKGPSSVQLLCTPGPPPKTHSCSCPGSINLVQG